VADDRSNMSPGATPADGIPGQPPGPASPPPPGGEAPGLREQLAATFEAVKRLIGAHVDLAKTELGEIVDNVKRTIALAGLAFAALLIMAVFLTFGVALFLGEWLFGSLGWGVLLGAALMFDLGMLSLLAALDVPRRRIGTAFGIAAVLGIVVGILLALGLARAGWQYVGDQAAPTVDAGPRPLIIALAIGLIGLGIIGFVLGLRDGMGKAIRNLLIGVLVGGILGVLSALSLPPNAGAAVGVLVWLIAWPILAGRDVIRNGVDSEALRKKFTPETTIELTKETVEWVRARTPLVPKS
jgi:MFS family permease